MERTKFDLSIVWTNMAELGSSHGHPGGVLGITGEFQKEDLLQEELRLKK